jgi:phage terminase large subunit GpA-like protein
VIHILDAPPLATVSRAVLDDVFAERARLTVSQWADAHRKLSTESSAEPGEFRTDRIPYMRWVQDLLGNETVPELVIAKAAQLAFSTMVSENFPGYTIEHDPSGFLVLWPTEKALRNWSTKRLTPMIRDTESLREIFPESGRRSSHDSIASKSFDGGYLAGLSAKSSADVRSFSARRVVCEEIDEYVQNLNNQGDVIELVRRRNSTFWNRKLVLNSTPTLKSFSRIWKELESSTWHEFHVPCPVCGHFQTLRFIDDADMGHAAPGTYRLVFERDAGGELIPGTCRYLCEACNHDIPERFKMQMLRAGQAAQDQGGGWIGRFPERWPHKVGVQINTLYTPLVGWDEIARSWLRATKSPDLMQAFYNTMLGLCYEETSERISAHFLANRAEPYPMDEETVLVPRGVGVLTAYVDVQGDRIELFVWGWGAEERSWVIDWIQFWGDPGTRDVWDRLDERLLAGWKHEDGATMFSAVTLVDAGYQTDVVWRFCEARKERRVLATVGRDGRGRKLIEEPTPQKWRKARKQRRPMHIIGVDSGKDLLASRLRITEKTQAGYVRFHDRLDPVFYDGLTAERLITRYRYRRPVRIWWLPPGLANEPLDGAVGAMAALAYLGVKVINQLGALAERVSQQGRALAAGSGAPATRAMPAARRVLSRGVE